MEKGKKLEWLMAVILLSAAYVLSREGARLVAAQKAATKVVVLDSAVPPKKRQKSRTEGSATTLKCVA